MPDHPVILRLNARTFPVHPIEKEILDPLHVQWIEIEGDNDDEILGSGRHADAVMIVSAYLHGPVIYRMENLKVIARLGTGVDKIDIDEATRQGILVTNSPDFSTDEVADHTMALLLASARKLKHHERLCRMGKRPASVEGMRRLSTQTLGIVGFGRIGHAVARRAAVFGMRILVHDPCLDSRALLESGIEPADFDTILEQSDFLAFLCPLTPETREMIAIEQLQKMKPTVTIINTGRGELFREKDVAEALKNGRIQAAGIDVYGGINVFQEEGFSTEHPYFSMQDNMILTPHVAANSEESLIHAKRDAAESVRDVLSGISPKHIVNKDVIPKLPLQGHISMTEREKW